MTNDQHHIQLNNLLYSCFDQKQRGSEQLIVEHALGYVISGEIHFQTINGVVVLEEGSIGTMRRNQLVKSIKVPPPGGVFKSLNIFITQDFLRKYCAENKIEAQEKYTAHP